MNRIKIDDYVSVNFHCSKFTLCDSAKVLRIPTATGDSWVFEDKYTGQIHYVSEPCTVSKIN